MQLCYQGKSCHDLGFTYPQFSPTLFSRVSVLMDYASLDIQALNFSYSTIACCCIYLACCSELALHVSGMKNVFSEMYKIFVVLFVYCVQLLINTHNSNKPYQLSVIISVGLTESDIAPCLDWLSTCWRSLKEVVPELRDDIKELPPGASIRTAFDDAYNLQKHIITLEVFVRYFSIRNL